ncbi:YjfB family protein [Clostridium aciditolerans]|uniref:YjfB family protein n=1 Tax=Clostridium aciditolerans TaxID=339861 RepID=A0A934M364_9CLOT|nr:YjfB family protein [Clostridium aciditolerans]MBI6872700.1 YjfB family protein [Clostridium aciditolerans]
MDIAGASMVMSQSKVMDQASIAVMKIAMNTGKENAQAMTDMLEKSVSPNLGQNLDIRV